MVADLVELNMGEVAEWFKAAVLKTVEGQPSGGSNPSLSANYSNTYNGRQKWVV